MHPAKEQPLDDLVTEMLERPLSRRELLRRGRNLGLTVAASSFLTACGTAVASQTHGGDPSGPAPKHLVMIIIDAGRADYLQYVNNPAYGLTNMKTLLETGTYYDRAWVGQMEATTPASHASIGSGCFPSHDGGILGFWWEDPNTQTTYNSVPLNGPGDPDTLSTIMANAGTPTMAEFLKRHDSRAKMYTASGQKFYAADAVGGVYADYVSYFHTTSHGHWAPKCMPGRELPPGLLSDQSVAPTIGSVADAYPGPNLGKQDALVGQLALNVIQKERPRVVILNLPEMDWPVAHRFGGPRAGGAVLRLMKTANQILGNIMGEYRSEGIYDQTVWVLMGDHGVTPMQYTVNQDDIKSAIEPSVDTVVTIDSHSSCFLWLAHLSSAPAAANALERSGVLSSAPGCKVYYLADQNGKQVFLPAPATSQFTPPSLLRAHQYLMSTMGGVNAPHVVVVFPERTGTEFAGGLGPNAWLGDHGGPSWGSQAIPLVMAGPGIKRSHTSHFPARLVDMAPTAMRLLGVPYPRTDGVVLADAMTNPQAADTARQNGIARDLIYHAEAIRRHSHHESQAMGRIIPFNWTQGGQNIGSAPQGY